MNPTVGIITTNHLRPHILNLFGAGIKRLREELNLDIPVVCVSGEEDEAILDQYKIKHIVQENIPVSNKFNTACEYMNSLGVEYTCILGSDNLIATDTFKRLMGEMRFGIDLIGIDQIYFYCTYGLERGEIVMLKTQDAKMLGVAKCIKRSVLEAVNFRPWNRNANFGLDAIARQAMIPYVKTRSIVSDAKVVDVKSPMNINKYHVFSRRLEKLDPEKLFYFLGAEEQSILKAL
jgi:hypothetical protein